VRIVLQIPDDYMAELLAQYVVIINVADPKNSRPNSRLPTAPKAFSSPATSLRVGCCLNCGVESCEDGKPLLKYAGGCDDSRYCSRACQKTHRPVHKVSCGFNGFKPRSAFDKLPISEDQKHAAKDAAKRAQSAIKRCVKCGVYQGRNGEPLLVCAGGCGDAYYCGEDCQKLHKSTHEEKCGPNSNNDPHAKCSGYLDRLVIELSDKLGADGNVTENGA
jgi:hypothetical protein